MPIFALVFCFYLNVTELNDRYGVLSKLDHIWKTKENVTKSFF